MTASEGYRLEACSATHERVVLFSKQGLQWKVTSELDQHAIESICERAGVGAEIN